MWETWSILVKLVRNWNIVIQDKFRDSPLYVHCYVSQKNHNSYVISYYMANFMFNLLILNPWTRLKYQNLSKGNILQSLCNNTFFLKLAHFDEIEIFQFLTNFTEITVVSHIVKLHFYNAPLWKAEKICNYWDANCLKLG